MGDVGEWRKARDAGNEVSLSLNNPRNRYSPVDREVCCKFIDVRADLRLAIYDLGRGRRPSTIGLQETLLWFRGGVNP